MITPKTPAISFGTASRLDLKPGMTIKFIPEATPQASDGKTVVITKMSPSRTIPNALPALQKAYPNGKMVYLEYQEAGAEDKKTCGRAVYFDMNGNTKQLDILI